MAHTGQMGAVVYARLYQRNQFLSFSLGLESAQHLPHCNLPPAPLLRSGAAAFSDAADI
jgi:hypothetical protein